MKYITLVIAVFCINALEANLTYQDASHKLEHMIDDVANNRVTIPNALLSIDENDIDILIKPSVIYSDHMEIIAEAKIASTGAAQGALCFDLNELPRLKQKYGSVIWVTDHINNDGLCHLNDLAGIFALKEDPSSHAVIVTRVSNLPCLTIPQNVTKKEKILETPSGKYYEGDIVTLDAFNGKLFFGALPLHHEVDSDLLNTIMAWAEKYAQLAVHGNADTPEESQLTINFGGKGVDPRTEHMFFHPERLHLFRKVILSKGENTSALNQLENLQRKDFIELYRTMKTYPAKIRLLDPPLHEFLPTDQNLINSLAADLDVSIDTLRKKIEDLHEINPMMGNRGIRLLLTFPAILKMQVRAIFEATLDPFVKQYSIEPWIIIPMIISDKEVIAVKKIIDEVCDEVCSNACAHITYHFGVMMETPRACLLASQIAPHVDFISFGTNDLTGQTLALSRGDVYNKFLKYYLDHNLLNSDPFSQLDPAVIQLLKTSVEQMRQANHFITIGICGEQASEKSGIFVCTQLGFQTVSCAPTRIPAVKLFAAQAAINEVLSH